VHPLSALSASSPVTSCGYARSHGAVSELPSSTAKTFSDSRAHPEILLNLIHELTGEDLASDLITKQT
jgi:hypothetical protein